MNTIRRQLLHIPIGDMKSAARWLFGKTFRMVLGSIAMILGIAYILEVSAITATGYDLASLERQIETLKQENQRLSFEIAGYQSMASIEKRIADLELVSIDTIEYLPSTDAIVARR